MTTAATDLPNFRATIERNIQIKAEPAIVFESIFEEMSAIPDGKGGVMNFKIERFPGGRWYRDLGNNAGHLWGHVQVIKPPMLIEITGPLMISSAVVNHLTYRIKAENGGSHLVLTHRIFGEFDPKLPEMVGGGWQMMLDRVKTRATKD